MACDDDGYLDVRAVFEKPSYFPFGFRDGNANVQRQLWLWRAGSLGGVRLFRSRISGISNWSLPTWWPLLSLRRLRKQPACQFIKSWDTRVWVCRARNSHVQTSIRNPPLHVVVVVSNSVELVARNAEDGPAARINGLVKFIRQRLYRNVRSLCDLFHYVAIRTASWDRKTHEAVDEQVAKLGSLGGLFVTEVPPEFRGCHGRGRIGSRLDAVLFWHIGIDVRISRFLY